jgi:hypothetical protein
MHHTEEKPHLTLGKIVDERGYLFARSSTCMSQRFCHACSGRSVGRVARSERVEHRLSYAQLSKARESSRSCAINISASSSPILKHGLEMPCDLGDTLEQFWLVHRRILPPQAGRMPRYARGCAFL